MKQLDELNEVTYVALTESEIKHRLPVHEFDAFIAFAKKFTRIWGKNYEFNFIDKTLKYDGDLNLSLKNREKVTNQRQGVRPIFVNGDIICSGSLISDLTSPLFCTGSVSAFNFLSEETCIIGGNLKSVQATLIRHYDNFGVQGEVEARWVSVNRDLLYQGEERGLKLSKSSSSIRTLKELLAWISPNIFNARCVYPPNEGEDQYGLEELICVDFVKAFEVLGKGEFFLRETSAPDEVVDAVVELFKPEVLDSNDPDPLYQHFYSEYMRFLNNEY